MVLMLHLHDLLKPGTLILLYYWLLIVNQPCYYVNPSLINPWFGLQLLSFTCYKWQRSR